MSLTLFDPAQTGAPAARPDPPAVQPGDRVFVPTAIALQCGRRIKRGSYQVLRVEWRDPRTATDPRPAWALVVEARLDCSGLTEQFRAPTEKQIQEAVAAGEPPPRTPFCALPTRVRLFPGDYTAYDAERTDGRHPATLSARSSALDR